MCMKHSHHPPEIKKNLLTRLSRLEGQVRSIRTMVEQDQYCDDLLQQVAAVRSALEGFARETVQSHLTHCIAPRLRDGDDTATEEFTVTLSRILR